MKETKASRGYALDPTIYPVDVTSGTTDIVTKTVNSVEEPLLDPMPILLKKQDAQTGNVWQGGATLEGAEFEVKFYDEIMNTDPAKEGYAPLRTWKFKTRTLETGPAAGECVLMYNDSFFVSGDSLYKNPLGFASLPAGTVTYRETKAPDGYNRNEEIYVQYLDTNDMSNGLPPVLHTPIIKEHNFQLDIKKLHEGKNLPIKGVTFRHNGPNGWQEDAVTDANGMVSFKGLTWGEHTITEIATVDGFAIGAIILR